MSRRGQCFKTADNKPMPNQGEVQLSLVAKGRNGRDVQLSSTMQVADVSRPIWGIGAVVDNQADDCEVVFRKGEAFARPIPANDYRSRIFATDVRARLYVCGSAALRLSLPWNFNNT